MGHPPLQIAIERLEMLEHAAHPQNRILTFVRPAAVCRFAAHFHFDPGESLMAHGDLEIGRLGHDGAAGTPFRNHGVGADAGVLFVDDGGENQPARWESALFRNDADGGNHGRHAALHVLRAASVEAAVPLDRRERIRHPCDADRVDVAAEHESVPRRTSFEHADRVGSTRRDLLCLDVEADAAHLGGNGTGDLRLAGRTGHERRVDGVDRDEVAEQANRWIHEGSKSTVRGTGARVLHGLPSPNV